MLSSFHLYSWGAKRAELYTFKIELLILGSFHNFISLSDEPIELAHCQKNKIELGNHLIYNRRGKCKLKTRAQDNLEHLVEVHSLIFSHTLALSSFILGPHLRKPVGGCLFTVFVMLKNDVAQWWWCCCAMICLPPPAKLENRQDSPEWVQE